MRLTAFRRPKTAESTEVDRCREGDGERDAGIAVVALQAEDKDGDEAGSNGDQPGETAEVHGAILTAAPMKSDTFSRKLREKHPFPPELPSDGRVTFPIPTT